MVSLQNANLIAFALLTLSLYVLNSKKLASFFLGIQLGTVLVYFKVIGV